MTEANKSPDQEEAPLPDIREIEKPDNMWDLLIASPTPRDPNYPDPDPPAPWWATTFIRMIRPETAPADPRETQLKGVAYRHYKLQQIQVLSDQLTHAPKSDEGELEIVRDWLRLVLKQCEEKKAALPDTEVAERKEWDKVIAKVMDVFDKAAWFVKMRFGDARPDQAEESEEKEES